MSRHCAQARWAAAMVGVAVASASLCYELSAQTAAPQPAAPAQPPANSANPKTAVAKKPARPGTEAAPVGKEAKRDPAESQRAIEAGIASYTSGKFDLAVQQLTAALSGGKLPAAQMARGFYFRGAAYRKQSKPAQAISDLTSAMWLKNGLNEADRADATAQRAAAYREAGLPDQTDGSPPKAGAAKPAARTEATQDTAAARAITVAAAAPAVAPTPAASAAPAQPAAASSGGGFFSSLFGGPSSPAPEAKPAPTQPQTSGWSDQVQVRRTSAPTVAAASPPAPAPVVMPPIPNAGKGATVPAAKPIETAAVPRAQAAPAAGAAQGRYQLQVAAVRSRAEAQAVADRIRQQHAKDLANRQAFIDETTVSSMGTFYRVRLGPFADANEPRALCGRLKGSGVDCMIVTP